MLLCNTATQEWLELNHETLKAAMSTWCFVVSAVQVIITILKLLMFEEMM